MRAVKIRNYGKDSDYSQLLPSSLDFDPLFNYVLIEISDDGPGFPEDLSKIIGEPYIASKVKKYKSKSGLGLGTFIGKTLLERKKAEIEFSKSELGGALVEITWKNSDLMTKQ